MPDDSKKPEIAPALTPPESRQENATDIASPRVSNVLLKLYPPDVSQKPGLSIDAWGKKIEDSLRSDPDFGKKIQQLIDDPNLPDEKVNSVLFKEWLNQRVLAALQKSRLDLAQGISAQVTAGPTAPAVSTPSAAPGSATATASPTVAPPVAGTASATAPGTPPGNQPAAVPGQAQNGAKPDLTKKGLGELLTGLMESAGRLQAMFGGMNISNFLQGVSGKKTDRFSNDEVAKIKVDLDKDKDKPYPSQDKSAEYVASAIGLPVRETPQKMLEAQKNSGMVFETDPGKMKDLKPGDVLYFQKKNEKGESYAYLCAVVSSSEPLKMKMIPRTGGTPQELSVEESDYFKNEWYGFVRLPGNAAAAPQAPTTAPPAKPPVAESQVTTPPATTPPTTPPASS